MKKLWILAASLIMIAAFVYAQDYGSLYGTVVDQMATPCLE